MIPDYAKRFDTFRVKTPSNQNSIFFLNRRRTEVGLAFLIHEKYRNTPLSKYEHAFHTETGMSTLQNFSSRMQIMECFAKPPKPTNHQHVLDPTEENLSSYCLLKICDKEWEAHKARFLDRAKILLNQNHLKNVAHLAKSLDDDNWDIYRAITTAKSCPHKLYNVPIYCLHLPTKLHDKLYQLEIHDVGSLINEELRRVLLCVDEEEAAVIERIANTLLQLQETSSIDD